jgi:trans-aconitate 2-methyltransferase
VSAHGAAREWDADTYARVSDGQFEWGLQVLDRLELRGEERVLDAGCGAGRVTAELVERFPHAHVIAVDGSEAMVSRTQELLGGRVEAFAADLVELELTEPVDAILSTAVFHWIPDHAKLFARLFECLRPGGQLEAQCGGAGNIAELHAVVDEVCTQAPYGQHFAGWRGPWRFATPEQTEPLLEAAGFSPVKCWLERKVLRSDEPEAFLRAVSLGTHLERLPEELRDPFVAAVAERMGSPLELHYVRLNISARRPAA